MGTPIRSHGPAFEANSENLKRMIHRSKSELSAGIVLQSLDASVLELHDLPAFGADHVVVVRAVGRFFILRVALREPVPRNETTLVEQAQSFIDRRARNFRAVVLEINKKIVGIEMIVPCENGIEHIEAFGRDPILPFLQKLAEVLMRFHRPARRSRSP